METCPRCGGSGSIRDDREIGAEMRRLRKAVGFTLLEWAAEVHFSPSYISDLENGRRQWNAGLMAKYAVLRESGGGS